LLMESLNVIIQVYTLYIYVWSSKNVAR
jgi:hypothetical protein